MCVSGTMFAASCYDNMWHRAVRLQRMQHEQRDEADFVCASIRCALIEARGRINNTLVLRGSEDDGRMTAGVVDTAG